MLRGRFGKNKISKISTLPLRIFTPLVTKSGVKPDFCPEPKFIVLYISFKYCCGHGGDDLHIYNVFESLTLERNCSHSAKNDAKVFNNCL